MVWIKSLNVPFWPANGPLNFVKKRQDSLVTFWTVHTKYANIIPLQLLTTTAFQEGSIVTTMVSKICLPTAKIRLFIELEQTHCAEDADPQMVHWTLWKKRQDALVTFWATHTKYANIIPLKIRQNSFILDFNSQSWRRVPFVLCLGTKVSSNFM